MVNVHHATAINPFINYPFLRPAAMKAYVDSAHARGMKVKIYYTVRELTDHAPELFALRSLGGEVIAHGQGGGSAWLQEHLDGDYISGWHVPELHDAAIVNTGISRWHNFYVEGLRWLVENVGIDGLYLDDVAFDRATMKRVRKVLRPGQPGVADRSALREPVQPAGRFRQQRQPVSGTLPVHRSSVVRRVLRLQLAPGVLAHRDERDSVRPDGGDAAGRRESLARDGVRDDQPAAVGRRSEADLEALGLVRDGPEHG